MIQTITPIDNTIYVEREYNSKIIEETISNSLTAQKEWASLKVEERVDLLKKFVSDFLSKEKQIIEEISATRITERGATRADDRVSEAAMEDRKKEGYF